MPRHPWIVLALAGAVTAGIARDAGADISITGYIGMTTAPTVRSTQGFAGSLGVFIVAFEFEYSRISGDDTTATPSLTMGMFNGMVQTPFVIKRLQFYGTIGGAVCHESLGNTANWSYGLNYGGGVKITIAGPLRARVDYRLFDLYGSAHTPKPQRLYAGLTLVF